MRRLTATLLALVLVVSACSTGALPFDRAMQRLDTLIEQSAIGEDAREGMERWRDDGFDCNEAKTSEPWWGALFYEEGSDLFAADRIIAWFVSFCLDFDMREVGDVIEAGTNNDVSLFHAESKLAQFRIVLGDD